MRVGKALALGLGALTALHVLASCAPPADATSQPSEVTAGATITSKTLVGGTTYFETVQTLDKSCFVVVFNQTSLTGDTGVARVLSVGPSVCEWHPKGG